MTNTWGDQKAEPPVTWEASEVSQPTGKRLLSK